MKNIIKYYRIVVRLIKSPASLGFVLAFAWEWLKLDFGTVRRITESPISSIIGLLFLYFISYFISVGLLKLTANTDFITESILRTELDEIIFEAEDYLYLVSPYLDPGNVLIESILATRRRNVDVVLIHNSNQIIKPRLNQDFNRLINSGVKVLNHPRLHSKIYINDKTALICSLNLVAGSYTESFESGISTTDQEIRYEALGYIDSVILESDQCNETKKEDLPPQEGFCISSKKTISFDPTHPVEYSEYKSNPGKIVGRYCHSCGKESNTSIGAPFCENCHEIHSLQTYQ